ncbi:MAG: NAD(P)/FAD-dependent oxidoreductase, partial [Nanoarchaeota archaeon]
MITIIGAGPAGSYLAYLLAKKGKEVYIIEEHNKVGSPVQCTGIVTGSIEKFVKLPKEVIANKCSKVVVVSKNEKIVAETEEIVMWRNKFDEFITNMAVDAGAKILTNHQFIGFNNKNSIRIKNKNNNETNEIKTDHIVGADGPSSAVAKATGLNSNSKFYIGMQAKVKLKADIGAFETHFGENFPNFFGWVVPESGDTARIGIGAFEN